jgi:nitrile hydratase subunit alpha
VSHEHEHGHGHGHGHSHGHHHHDDDDVQEHREHGAPLSEVELRVRALESLLVDKGLVEPAALDALIDTYETKVGPRNGAKIVARAWVDPVFKARLLEDGTSAVAEHGFVGRQSEKLVVVENTPSVHNMVVCTLCSCYPWAVLGLPPVWYKSAPYRSRAVIDPRGVLTELGVSVPADTEVRVWDSTAEIRYMVLPERPAGTERMSEAQLAELVTRDAMIGVAQVSASGEPR